MAPKGYTLSAESRAKITGRPITSTEPGAVHLWLRKHYPKTRVCQECGAEGRTDLAYLHHPQPHTRNRADYLELCRKCHRKMDDPIYKWSEQLPTAATREQRQAAGRKGAAVRWGLTMGIIFYLLAMCCARYRSKDETDLVWNRTRRRITRDLDTRIQDFREELLNQMLTDAWEKYVKALDTGSLVQLEDEASTWVNDILTRQLKPSIEADLGDVARG